MHTRRLLDLFCGAGLAAWGYWLSGRFTEIVGVDIDDKSRCYSFDFIQADALTLTYEFLDQFDYIHASPPCQAYSKATPASHRANHPRLIIPTRRMLAAAGKPHTIENVEGSSAELRPNLVINGHGVGLPSDRKRYFYVSELKQQRSFLSSGQSIHIHGRRSPTRAEVIRAFGLTAINERRLRNLSIPDMEQGIPPAFTKLIAETVIPSPITIN